MRYVFVLLVTVAGCAPAPVRPADSCGRAAARLDACGVAGAAAIPADCDVEAARAVAGLDCAALTSVRREIRPDSLGDGLRAIACAAGLIRFCDVPACAAPPYPGPSTVCASYIADPSCGGCQYYACREASGHCGPSGYYVGYAEKYCTRFLQALRPRMSPAGQRFLDAGRDCLMRYVEDELPPDDACDDVKRRAFDSHVACYHDNGFCDLPLSDRLLLINAVDPADVDLSAALRTALSCL